MGEADSNPCAQVNVHIVTKYTAQQRYDMLQRKTNPDQVTREVLLYRQDSAVSLIGSLCAETEESE